MKPQIFESRPHEHLDALVDRAALQDTAAPASVIDLETPTGTDASAARQPHVSIEAAFTTRDGQRVIDTLEVRLRKYGARASRELLDELLGRFGSMRYTSLSTVNALAARGRFDVTVMFPTRLLPFVARNLALVPEQPMDRPGRALSRILQALGVRHRAVGSGFEISGWQLRRPLRREALVRAYEAARDEGVAISLYAAALPVTQSVRIEEAEAIPEGEHRQVPYVDCFLSRGLSPSRPCTAEDAGAMEEIVQRHFGIDFGGRIWTLVRDTPPASPHGMAYVMHASSEAPRRAQPYGQAR